MGDPGLFVYAGGDPVETVVLALLAEQRRKWKEMEEMGDSHEWHCRVFWANRRTPHKDARQIL
jgi:hypothetical protein